MPAMMAVSFLAVVVLIPSRQRRTPLTDVTVARRPPLAVLRVREAVAVLLLLLLLRKCRE